MATRTWFTGPGRPLTARTESRDRMLQSDPARVTPLAEPLPRRPAGARSRQPGGTSSSAPRRSCVVPHALPAGTGASSSLDEIGDLAPLPFLLCSRQRAAAQD